MRIETISPRCMRSFHVAHFRCDRRTRKKRDGSSRSPSDCPFSIRYVVLRFYCACVVEFCVVRKIINEHVSEERLPEQDKRIVEEEQELAELKAWMDSCQEEMGKQWGTLRYDSNRAVKYVTCIAPCCVFLRRKITKSFIVGCITC